MINIINQWNSRLQCYRFKENYAWTFFIHIYEQVLTITNKGHWFFQSYQN